MCKDMPAIRPETVPGPSTSFYAVPCRDDHSTLPLNDLASLKPQLTKLLTGQPHHSQMNPLLAAVTQLTGLESLTDQCANTLLSLFILMLCRASRCRALRSPFWRRFKQTHVSFSVLASSFRFTWYTPGKGGTSLEL